jgi:hypothetical protein
MAMQWGFDGKPTWSAPKAVGLWFTVVFALFLRFVIWGAMTYFFPADGSRRGIRPVNRFHHIGGDASDRADGSREGKPCAMMSKAGSDAACRR